MNKKHAIIVITTIITALIIGIWYTSSESNSEFELTGSFGKHETSKFNEDFKYTEPLLHQNVTEEQATNLQKLAKVWGFVKYHHPAFIIDGEDWDEALFCLLPKVYEAGSDVEVDAILYDWIIGLSDIGNYPVNPEAVNFKNISEELISIQVDKSWLINESYLGSTLRAELMRLEHAAIMPGRYAPSIIGNGVVSFVNEEAYFDMDYSDSSYRLLGLFRVWNAWEYYFPYKGILDYGWNWDDVLLEFIPKMLEGTDEHSYLLTLAELSTKLNDPHVLFGNASFFMKEFGTYSVPIELTRVEGQFVASHVFDDNILLKSGDIILAVDDISIDDIITNRKQYVAVPNDEKILSMLWWAILRSHNSDFIEVTVLRDNSEISLQISYDSNIFRFDDINSRNSYGILENNIILINPSSFRGNELASTLEKYPYSNGVIIDLRQYPFDRTFMNSAAIPLLDKEYQYAVNTIPSKAVPGMYINQIATSGRSNTDYYSGKVVVLIDETTVSAGELAAMSLRNAPNAVIIGNNSIGALGAVSHLPIPGGNNIRYSSLGTFTMDGAPILPAGLSPDIYVERTIQGIKEGRDEIMEAAVRYILGE